MTPTDIEVRLRTALNELTDTTPLANSDHPPGGAMRGGAMTTGAPLQKRRPALLLVGLFAVVVIAVALGVFYGQRSPVKGVDHPLRPAQKVVPVPVGFEVSVNGQAATTPGATIPTGPNTPVSIPSGEHTVIDISVTVPSGSSLNDLEIGTGPSGGWGIGPGGPSGVELLLLKSHAVYEGGVHQFVVTLPAQPPGSENLFAYYHATPQPHSGQSNGWTVQDLAVLLVQAWRRSPSSESGFSYPPTNGLAAGFDRPSLESQGRTRQSQTGDVGSPM